MNYYPNYYAGAQNYPNPTYMQPAPAAPLQQLNGKLVDGPDMVKATDVPIGGYGIFPKADLSEIYVKTWNSSGTTSIITFKPAEAPVAEPDASQTAAEILTKVNALEVKLDTLMGKKDQVSTNEY